ncbi:MAG: FMN-binding negative transcriptional regulator [Chloroflexota bacterium]
MYQPAHGKFEVSDPAALLAELATTAPATLVTADADGFETSVLPMIFDPTVGDDGVLLGHLARPNPQWVAAADAHLGADAPLGADAHLGGDGTGHAETRPAETRPAETDTRGRAIAIFHGPDAYVSPAWYEEKARTGRVVPTWNYVVVVAYGTLIVHDDPDWLRAHVRALVDRHEAMRPEPWSVDDAPPAFIDGQVRGIVGLELVIERIEAKRKLSQNRSAVDVARVIAALDEGTAMEQAVAQAMRPPADPTVRPPEASSPRPG